MITVDYGFPIFIFGSLYCLEILWIHTVVCAQTHCHSTAHGVSILILQDRVALSNFMKTHLLVFEPKIAIVLQPLSGTLVAAWTLLIVWSLCKFCRILKNFEILWILTGWCRDLLLRYSPTDIVHHICSFIRYLATAMSSQRPKINASWPYDFIKFGEHWFSMFR